MSYPYTQTLSSCIVGVSMVPLHRAFYASGINFIDKNRFNLIRSDKDWSRARASVPFLSLITLIAAQCLLRHCLFLNIHAIALPSLLYECYLTKKTQDVTNIHSHIKESTSQLGFLLNMTIYLVTGWTLKNAFWK